MVMCEGTDSDGEPKFCFCFSRQIRGCEDPLMKVSKHSIKELFIKLEQFNMLRSEYENIHVKKL